MHRLLRRRAQRKGFFHIPAIVEGLLADYVEPGKVRFLVQGSLSHPEWNAKSAAALEELKAYPTNQVRIVGLDAPLSTRGVLPARFGSRSALVSLQPPCYKRRSSGTLTEAIAAGIPTVVPQGTWLATQQPAGTGEQFFDELSLVAAVRKICDNYDRYFSCARLAKEEWLSFHSPAELVKQLVDQPCERRVDHDPYARWPEARYPERRTMRLKHFYTWGCFHPMTSGADLVVSNQFEYFRDRGWVVDCIIAKTRKDRHFEAFCDTVSLGRIRSRPSTSRRAVFASRPLVRLRHACSTAKLRDVLAAPADLFLTNYVFTSPLVPFLPTGCKRVAGNCRHHDPAVCLHRAQKGGPAPADRGALAAAHDSYLFNVELDLYRLFDATIMINRNEHELVKSRGINHSFYVPQMYPHQGAVGHGRPRSIRLRLDLCRLQCPDQCPWSDLVLPRSLRALLVAAQGPNGRGRRSLRPPRVRGCQRYLLPQIDHSLDSLYDATKLVINPIFEGTGLSIKTLEGLANGRAMVATPAGARGLEDAEGAFVTIDMKADPAGTADDHPGAFGLAK